MTTHDRLPVVWLARARDQRNRQLEFYLRHNPALGIRIGDAVAATVAQLVDNPDLSRVGRMTGARELTVADTPFTLVYRIEQEAVVVLRLLHNHRRFPTREDAGVERKPKEASIVSRVVESMTSPISDLRARVARLPRRAQRDIERAVIVLREEFAKAVAGRKSEHLRNGRILKIILFGSYAKGKQVVDPVGRYFSDYDLLVVVNHEDLTDASEFWSDAEDKLVDMLAEGFWPQPLTLIVHSIDDINEQLRRGRYFWVDIVKEGIALFEEPGFSFERPGVLTKEEAREEARLYYAREFTGIGRALKTAELQRGQSQLENDSNERAKWRNEAAFQLHQAMERAYYCLLLVTLLFQPKSHSLNFLSKRGEQIDQRLMGVWKQDTKFGKRCYELLRAAYIKARYSPHYKIDDDELDWIAERVIDLHARVKLICEERLARPIEE